MFARGRIPGERNAVRKEKHLGLTVFRQVYPALPRLPRRRCGTLLLPGPFICTRLRTCQEYSVHFQEHTRELGHALRSGRQRPGDGRSRPRRLPPQDGSPGSGHQGERHDVSVLLSSYASRALPKAEDSPFRFPPPQERNGERHRPHYRAGHRIHARTPSHQGQGLPYRRHTAQAI